LVRRSFEGDAGGDDDGADDDGHGLRRDVSWRRELAVVC